MIRNRPLTLPLLPLALLLPLASWADTLILTDGTELQGELVSETPEQVRFRVQITPTQRQLRTIPREEIRRVRRETADEREIGSIVALHPTPELLDAKGYDERIRQAEDFIKAYPESRSLARAEEVRDKLKEERARVGQGQRLLDGRWLSQFQLDNRKPEVESILRLSRLQNELAVPRWSGVMPVFDDLEQHYRGTRGYDEAISLALGSPAKPGFLSRYRSALADQLQRIQRGQDSEIEGGAEKPASSANIESQRQAEERQGRKWLSLDDANPEHLQEAIALAQEETTRLSAETASARSAQEAALTQIYEAFDRGHLDGLEEQVGKLRELGVGEVVQTQVEARLEKLTTTPPSSADLQSVVPDA